MKEIIDELTGYFLKVQEFDKDSAQDGQVWKPVKDYELLYEVSSLGHVRSLSRTVTCRYNKTRIHKGKLLKPIYVKGYGKINLFKNNIIKQFSIHRLVANAFIPNPKNKPQVNHINGNKADNRVKNLEWCTSSENELHSYNVLGKIGGKPYLGKLNGDHSKSIPIIQFTMDGGKIKTWSCAAEVERSLGFNAINIRACALGISKSSNGFKWVYNK
jgi:hypothetical protein